MHATLPLKRVDCQPLKAFDFTPERGKNIFTMNLAERFKEAREAAGYSQEELAKEAGVVQQTINKIETGVIRNPRKLPLFESIFGLPAGYLMHGEKTESNISTLPQPIIARCPILQWDIAIQWPANKNHILRDKKVEVLAQKIILSADCYALRINNDAMTEGGGKPSFNEGSYIIVNPNAEYKNGSLVIAAENSKSLLFRRYVKDGEREYLFAYNGKYESVKLNESLKICGVVVAHLDVLV